MRVDMPGEPEREPESRKCLTRMETEILQDRPDVMPELQRFPKQLQTPVPRKGVGSTGEVGLCAQKELEQKLEESVELSLLPAPFWFALAGWALGSRQTRRQGLL